MRFYFLYNGVESFPEDLTDIMVPYLNDEEVDFLNLAGRLYSGLEEKTMGKQRPDNRLLNIISFSTSVIHWWHKCHRVLSHVENEGH